ncbi:uncharacterized protein LOC113467599 [Gryllus bimaculatus]|nr:uncharacterized protein LOC113467599 [Gryllus bimaculatus]
MMQSLPCYGGIEFGGDASAVPEATLRQLGWALAGAPPDHLRNLSVVDVDTVAALGAAPGLNALQLCALAERIVEDWGSKRPEEYSHLDLAALRRILEAAPELAGLKNCPKEVLQSLAKLATDSKAFGDPAHWTDTQVRSVGCIIGGLPLFSFSSITTAAMEGMTPQAVPCLTIEQIKSCKS